MTSHASSPTSTHAYTPVGNLEGVFYASDREVLVCGPAGTGKSRACLEKMVYLALHFPKARFLIVRKTRESINSSVAVTLKDYVIPHLLESGDVRDAGASSRKPRQFEFSNGSVILTVGMDDREKIKSTEFDMIFVNEATELSESDWNYLLTRLRGNALPKLQILADCNPSYPYHWLKKRADLGKIRLINTTHQDNPVYWRDGDWTVAGRNYVLGSLASMSGVDRARLYEGRWAATEGLIYDTFDDTLHITDIKVGNDWPRIWSVDFGFRDPFVTQVWAIDPDGRMILEHEIYMTDRTIAEHCKTLSLLAKRHRPSIVVCDSASPEGMEQIRRELNLNVIKATKDILVGIGLVQNRLKRDADGLPRLMLHRTALISPDQALLDANQPYCTASEFLSYAWHPFKPDVPVDKYNHGMDAMRYAVMHLDKKSTPRVRVMYY